MAKGEGCKELKGRMGASKGREGGREGTRERLLRAGRKGLMFVQHFKDGKGYPSGASVEDNTGG